MEEDLLDRDLDDDLRPVTLDDHLVEVRRIGQQRRPPVDPQRVAAAGHQEQQSDVRILQHVAVAVDALVADALGDRDRRLVDHVGHSDRIALGGHIAAPIGAGRTDQAERGLLDPADLLGREGPPILLQDAVERFSEQSAERGQGRDFGAHGFSV